MHNSDEDDRQKTGLCSALNAEEPGRCLTAPSDDIGQADFTLGEEVGNPISYAAR